MSTANSKTLGFGDKEFQKLSNKIQKRAKQANIDINKQFFLDVLSGNYKIKGKNGAILIAAITYLIMPTDKLTGIIFGRIAFLVDGALGFLDEVLVIGKIIDIIKEESNSYQQFTSKRGYKPSTITNPIQKVDINKGFKYLINSLESNQKIDNDNNSLSLLQHIPTFSEYINYETEDYRNIICEFISQESLKSKDGFVLIDINKIRKLLAFPDRFDEKQCRDTMENKMDVELIHGGKHDLYRLATPVMLPWSYLVPSKNNIPNIIYDKLKYIDFGTTRVYELSQLQLNLKLLLSIVNEIRALDNEQVQIILFKLNSMVVEVNLSQNKTVQVITDDVSMIKVASQLEDQLTTFMKKYKGIRLNPFTVIKPSSSNNNDTDTNQQIQIAINRIHMISEDTQARTLKHNDFIKFIPLYKRQLKDQYIASVQRDYKQTIVNKDTIEIKFADNPFSSNQIDSFNITTMSTYVMMKKTIPGRMSANHLLNTIETLLLVQNYANSAPLLDIVATIDCTNGLIVQTNFKDNSVRIIDAKATLNFQEEEHLEQIISKELKNNLKLIDKYS